MVDAVVRQAEAAGGALSASIYRHHPSTTAASAASGAMRPLMLRERLRPRSRKVDFHALFFLLAHENKACTYGLRCTRTKAVE